MASYTVVLIMLIVFGLFLFVLITCAVAGGKTRHRQDVFSMSDCQLKKAYEAQKEAEELANGQFDAFYFDTLYEEMLRRNFL